ncbi:MAG: AAA family ATPase [Candidatus Eisenbacteria bacterium]|nr:AAA family ATPase [Candidatus Eisenbacteria bacterium]
MPTITSLELQGFRAFGSCAQKLQFQGSLAVVWGPNSQGKTSLAEAIEFLMTGRTSRRELLASAKAEFKDSLRNVHIAPSDGVYVAADVLGLDGCAHRLVRRLVCDYTGQDECRSELTVDGLACEDLRTLGIPDWGPPLSAPVLMQHTLRHVISAGPQERTDYFKALLEVDDLEIVRGEVLGLAESVGGPDAPEVTALRACLTVDALREPCSWILEEGSSHSRLLELLSEGVGRLLNELGVEAAEMPESLAERVGALRAKMRSRREREFPLRSLQPGDEADFGMAEVDLAEVGQYNLRQEQVNKDSARLVGLFQAALRIPEVDGAETAMDCPLCTSAGALTPERIEQIRREVANSELFREAMEKALHELASLEQRVADARRIVDRTAPPAISWSGSEANGQREAATRLLGDEVGTLYTPIEALLEKLRALVRLAHASSDTLFAAIRASRTRIEEIEAVDVGFLRRLIRESQVAFENVVRAVREEYMPQARGTIARLREEADLRARIAGWQGFLALAFNPEGLLSALRSQRARALVHQEIADSVREIDAAKARILDARLAELSNEIDYWWGALRPNEAVSFGKVSRRGQGLRFTDLIASMVAEPGSPAKERHAVAVFSDSQMNCLGLATFLARCVRSDCPVVVLDDPVLASDPEHCITFARYCVGKLLGKGLQVLVTTNNRELKDRIEDYYGHLQMDSFNVAIDDRKDGACVEWTSNSIEYRLAMAARYINNTDSGIRKLASQHLRDATERFCKKLLVKHDRVTKPESSVVDYQGCTLEWLAPKACKFLTADPADSGKLIAVQKTLNPGSHDDAVLDSTSLSVVAGDLKKLAKDYL